MMIGWWCIMTGFTTVSTAAGPSQLGNRHDLRQADGRWRAPHAIPASPPQSTVQAVQAHRIGPHSADRWNKWKVQVTPPPPSLTARPAWPSAHCRRRGATLHPLFAPVLGL